MTPAQVDEIEHRHSRALECGVGGTSTADALMLATALREAWARLEYWQAEANNRGCACSPAEAEDDVDECNFHKAVRRERDEARALLAEAVTVMERFAVVCDAALDERDNARRLYRDADAARAVLAHNLDVLIAERSAGSAPPLKESQPEEQEAPYERP